MRVAVLAPRRLNEYYVRVLAPLFTDDRIEVAGAVIDARAPVPLSAKLRRELKRGRGGYVGVMAARSLMRRRGGAEGTGTAEHLAAHGAATLAVSDLYADATVAWLRALEPDCLLRIGFGIIREPILSLTPQGVLSYHHGNMRRYRGQPPAFWEVYEGARAIGVTVQRLSAELDAGEVVCERSFEIAPADSWRAVRARIYGDTDTMMHEACLRAADPGFRAERIPSADLGPLYTTPNLRQWVGMHARTARRRIAQ